MRAARLRFHCVRSRTTPIASRSEIYSLQSSQAFSARSQSWVARSQAFA